MMYATICSGIEAVSVALSGLDAEPVFFADVESFPKALLAHHYPDVPDLGDMTKWRDWPEELLVQADVIVAGTPCQAFSVAGARKSLDDDRGNLTLEFVRLCNAIDNFRRDSGLPPVTIVWENVPGVLSVADNAFGCFLAGVAGSDAPVPPPEGRSWTDAGVVSGPSRAVAWRCLDAQFFGVAQRRKRVFAVASAGDGPHPAQILFEPEGVRRDSAPSREAGQRTAGGAGEGFETVGALTDGAHNGGGLNGQDAFTGRVLPCNRDGAPIAFAHIDNENNAYDMIRPAGPLAADSMSGGGRPLPAIAIRTANTGANGHGISEEAAHTLDQAQGQVVAFNWQSGGDCWINPNTEGTDALQCSQTPAVGVDCYNGAITNDVAATMGTHGSPKAGSAGPQVMARMAVRRLTPVECERLQGFPDNYTRIPYRNKPASQCPDGPRYRALGNSMAVPVMRWILKRVMA